MSSTVATIGDGVTVDFNIPFPYLNKVYVNVHVNNSPVAFTWLNASTVRLAVAPAAGTAVRRFRVTPSEPIVVLNNTNPNPSSNFTKLTTQALHVAQELHELSAMEEQAALSFSYAEAAQDYRDEAAASADLITGGGPNGFVTPEMFGAVGDNAALDTAGWQAALAYGTNVKGRFGRNYLINAPLGSPVPGAVIDLNGSKLSASWVHGIVYQAVFFIDGPDRVTFRNGEITWLGDFPAGDYTGLVSGIHANNSDYLWVDNMNINGFSRAGVFVGSITSGGVTGVCQSPKVTNSFCHHNRVGGILFGYTRDGIVEANELTFNGHVGSIGTGYGFAGWSIGDPINTMVANNQANDNYRKGIDFHSGVHGSITGNNCARNRVMGIYANSVSGTWNITGNTITEMFWDNTFSSIAMICVSIGATVGQGVSSIPTTFNVVGNNISKVSSSAGSVYPFILYGAGLSYGAFNISENTVDVGRVDRFVSSDVSPASGVAGNWYDVTINNNQWVASEILSIPFYVRSANNRKKSFCNNQVSVTTCVGSSGVYIYDNTSIADRSLVANGNSITVPATVFGLYDAIVCKRVSNEMMMGNVVNGSPSRDWNGRAFSETLAALPVTAITYSVGSRIFNSATPALGVPTEWLRLTTGTGQVLGTDWMPNYLNGWLEGTVVFDCPSLLDGAGTTATITVAGAAVGDFVLVNHPASLAGIILTAQVSAANTVLVRYQNETGGTLDPASVTIKARVLKA